jgi:hypothetical protein
MQRRRVLGTDLYVQAHKATDGGLKPSLAT